jgi:hypothetical protein
MLGPTIKNLFYGYIKVLFLGANNRRMKLPVYPHPILGIHGVILQSSIYLQDAQKDDIPFIFGE